MPSNSKKIKRLLGQWADIENAELDTGLDELEQYLQHKPTMKNDRDIFSFWKHDQNVFPSMAWLTRKILCVPASSVSCESAFSISGRALENHRTCLSTASVNALLFLNRNMWKWKLKWKTQLCTAYLVFKINETSVIIYSPSCSKPV